MTDKIPGATPIDPFDEVPSRFGTFMEFMEFPVDTDHKMKDGRVYTMEALFCKLAMLAYQIDGPPMAYMEFPVDVERPDDRGIHVVTERRLVRWEYVTLRLGSHLENPMASVELLTQFYKTIKNAVSQLEGTCHPLIVWRQRPTFEEDIDQGVTYLRCRLYIPGVKLDGITWVEGV